MKSFTNENLLRERLFNILKKQGTERKQIDFLKNCIISSGNMDPWDNYGIDQKDDDLFED